MLAYHTQEYSGTYIKVEWYPIYGPKSLFKFGEKRPIVCYCTHEQKMNFEGFTQNGWGAAFWGIDL